MEDTPFEIAVHETSYPMVQPLNHSGPANHALQNRVYQTQLDKTRGFPEYQGEYDPRWVHPSLPEYYLEY